MKIKLPEKVITIMGGKDASYWNGYNDAIEACQKAVEDANPIHKCKCCNEGVRTLRIIDKGLWQCPRCGGIVVFKDAQGRKRRGLTNGKLGKSEFQ